MSNWMAMAIGFIAGAFFMILARMFIYNLGLLTIKKGERLKHKGEELAATADKLINDLEDIQRKLSNGR